MLCRSIDTLSAALDLSFLSLPRGHFSNGLHSLTFVSKFSSQRDRKRCLGRTENVREWNSSVHSSVPAMARDMSDDAFAATPTSWFTSSSTKTTTAILQYCSHVCIESWWKGWIGKSLAVQDESFLLWEIGSLLWYRETCLCLSQQGRQE